MAKPAILNQLESAIRARNRRQQQEREKRLLEEGAAGRVKVSFSQGGQKALGVAFAQQQLVAALLKEPSYVPLAAARVKPEAFLDEGLGQAYALVVQRVQNGENADVASLSGEIPEATLALISRVLAQNYDVGFSRQDVEMYLDRIEHSVPESSRAAQKTADELADYLQALKDKKG